MRPGIDAAGFNRLADEIEDEAVVEKAARNLTTAVQPAAHAIEHSREIPSTGSAG